MVTRWIILAKHSGFASAIKGEKESIHFTIRMIFKYHSAESENHCVHECRGRWERLETRPRICPTLPWRNKIWKNIALLYDTGGSLHGGRISFPKTPEHSKIFLKLYSTVRIFRGNFLPRFFHSLIKQILYDALWNEIPII